MPTEVGREFSVKQSVRHEWRRPITRQSQEVLALIFKKNVLGQTLWEVQIHYRKKQIVTLPAQVADLEARIAAACQPKTHRFTIKPNAD